MNMLKNIVIVNDWGCIEGGAANVAINTAIALSSQYNVYLFCAVKPIEKRLVENGVKVVCLDKIDVLHDPNRFHAITKGVWDNQVKSTLLDLLSKLDKNETIVHVHTWTKALSSSIFAATSETDFHLVITLHDFFCFCPNGGFYNYVSNHICHLRPMSVPCMMSNCDARSYPQKLWRVTRMIVQNKALWSNKKLSFISISKLTDKVCIPLIRQHANVYKLMDPVDIKKQIPTDISNNEYYVCMSRLSPEKGTELFCKAITDLKLKGIVMGDGYLRDTLQKKYPNIIFTGWVTGAEKEKYFRKAKCFVFTSLWYETFGLAVAEAKSYGIPCIVPDECAASEQVEDSKTGYIFKTGNIESLKSTLQKYETSDIQRMQQMLIGSFDIESLSMNNHVKGLVKIYEQILSL